MGLRRSLFLSALLLIIGLKIKNFKILGFFRFDFVNSPGHARPGN